MYQIDKILSRFNAVTGEIPGAKAAARHLADLRGCFANEAAFETMVAAGNPLIYTVTSFEGGQGEGDLHYGIGLIMPGQVGDEYFMTKGHLHSWRAAAEFYIGLTGEGVMLLENEDSGESRMVPLTASHVIYVPGKTAHRTMNTGTGPMTYLGIYPAKAGHDYGAIAKRNFLNVVAECDGRPKMIPRTRFQAMLAR